MITIAVAVLGIFITTFSRPKKAAALPTRNPLIVIVGSPRNINLTVICLTATVLPSSTVDLAIQNGLIMSTGSYLSIAFILKTPMIE